MSRSKECVQMVVETATACSLPPPIMYDVLHNRGIAFTKLADEQPNLGMLGRCFMNAYRLAVAERLHYCEGFAVPHGVGIPLEHAWCCDDAGHVYDPTWVDGTDYLGVPIALDVLEYFMQESGAYGLFGNLYRLQMTGEDVRKTLLDAVIDIQL